MTRRPIRPAEVALGLVDPADEPEVRRLLAEDPLFREEVARLRQTTTLLEQLDRSAWRPGPPPALAVPAAADTPARRPRRWWRVAVPAAGLAAAAAAAALVLGGGSPAPAGRSVALRTIGGVSGSATLTVTGSEAQLRGVGLPPSGPHEYYEAWLADRRGRTVPMGTFHVGADGRVDAQMAVAVRLADYRLVDVSLEPDDGDPAHSSRSVLRGRL